MTPSHELDGSDYSGDYNLTKQGSSYSSAMPEKGFGATGSNWERFWLSPWDGEIGSAGPSPSD